LIFLGNLKIEYRFGAIHPIRKTLKTTCGRLD